MKNQKAYIWSLIGRTVPQLVLLVATMLLSRLLSPKEFGMIGVLSIIYTVANTILDSGLGGSLIKEQNITKSDCSTIFTFNLLASIILYCIIFCISPFVADFYNINELENVTRVLSLMLIINAFGLVPASLLLKELKLKERTIANIIAAITSAIVATILAFNGFGVYSLVALQIVQAFVNTLLYHHFNKFALSFAFSTISFKKLYKFGVFTTLANIVDTIYENVLTAFCGKYLNIQQAGYLSQGKRIEDVASQSIFQTINAVSFPVLAKIVHDSKAFMEECNQIIKYVILIACPPMLTLAIYSKEIIALLFGDKWIESAHFLSMLVFAALFIILENTNRNFIKALGKVSSLFTFTIIKRVIGITIIIISLLTNPIYMLWAYLISSFIGFLFNCLLFCKLTSINVVPYIFLHIKLLSIPFLFYIANIAINSQFQNYLIIQITITIILLAIYYLIIMPKLGINILKGIISKIRL